AASLPGLFGMGHSISGERRTQTLAVLLASPANRLALFLGRALPAIANGFLVAAFCFGAGALLLRFNAGAMTLPGLALAMLVCSFSCTSLGLCVGALGLRGRNVSVLADMSFGLLLVIAGVDVPLARLPAWTRTLGAWLPLTHGTRAAREIVSGASIDRASHLLVLELIIGASYLAI